MANQFRNYILTVNNPVQTDTDFYEYLKTLPNVKYFAFQREAGDNTGTEHFQVYIEFDLGKRFATMKEYFPTAHIESRKGSKRQARDYCQKDDTRVTGHDKYEYGDFVESGERSDLNDITQMIENGASDGEIRSAYPSQFFRYYKNISQIRQVCLEAKFDDVFRHLEITYIYGSTETGKTRYVLEKYGYRNVYRVTSYDHSAFDNYKGQDIIIFEEFRSSFKIEDMLKYLEGYPLMLPSRYENKAACYTKVYILTNWALCEQYKNIQQEHPTTWEAFLRRIRRVYNFDVSKDTPINKATGKPYQTTADLIPLSEEEQGKLGF
ncbi:hypothetical protein FACS1894211_15820 [Clostridia bacterium]|nr:hypothetical protein FACS1894211_15820 [Clostridia bacterium]